MIGVLVTLLSSVAQPATGHLDVVFDDDDTSGPLDLVYTTLRDRKTETGRILTLRGTTYERWRSSVLDQGSGKRWISFEFNLERDETRERRIFVTHDEGELIARMFGPGFGDPYFTNSRFIGRADVLRPDGHSVKITFRRRMLGKGVRSFRWLATASYEEWGQFAETCPVPEPHGDGGYGVCRDFTKQTRHSIGSR